MSTHLSEIARPTPRMAQVVPWGRHPGLLSKIVEGFAESSATPDVRHVVAAWQRVENSRESPS